MKKKIITFNQTQKNKNNKENIIHKCQEDNMLKENQLINSLLLYFPKHEEYQ